MNQDKLPVPSEEERRDIEEQIKRVEADCTALDQELKGAEGALSSINAQISDADLDQMLAQLEDETVTLEKKLANLERPDRPPIPAGRKDALKRKFTTYRVRPGDESLFYVEGWISNGCLVFAVECLGDTQADRDGCAQSNRRWYGEETQGRVQHDRH
jgi:hypothetical protein